MSIAIDKTQMRIIAAGNFNHSRTEVNPHTISRLKSGEKIAPAAAHFQNTRAGRNQRTIDIGQTFLVVFAGALPPAEAARELHPVFDARPGIGGKSRGVFGHRMPPNFIGRQARAGPSPESWPDCPARPGSRDPAVRASPNCAAAWLPTGLLGESDPHVVMRFGITRVELQCLLKMRQGLLDPAVAGKNVAEVELGFAVVRFEVQCFCIVFDGLVGCPVPARAIPRLLSASG